MFMMTINYKNENNMTEASASVCLLLAKALVSYKNSVKLVKNKTQFCSQVSRIFFVLVSVCVFICMPVRCTVKFNDGKLVEVLRKTFWMPMNTSGGGIRRRSVSTQTTFLCFAL